MSEIVENEVLDSELEQLVDHFDRLGIHGDVADWIEDGFPELPNTVTRARFREAVNKARFFGLEEAAIYIASRLP